MLNASVSIDHNTTTFIHSFHFHTTTCYSKTQSLPLMTPETMTVCLYFTYIKFINKWTAESCFADNSKDSNSLGGTAHCNNSGPFTLKEFCCISSLDWSCIPRLLYLRTYTALHHSQGIGTDNSYPWVPLQHILTKHLRHLINRLIAKWIETSR